MIKNNKNIYKNKFVEIDKYLKDDFLVQLKLLIKNNSFKLNDYELWGENYLKKNIFIQNFFTSIARYL